MDLTDKLKLLGVEELFGHSANLSGITPDIPLYVSTVVHKSFIQVNENGTEAAAATGNYIQGMVGGLKGGRKRWRKKGREEVKGLGTRKALPCKASLHDSETSLDFWNAVFYSIIRLSSMRFPHAVN